MTTFTDKGLIKEIESESAAWTCETILNAGLMKSHWHRWKLGLLHGGIVT